MAEAVMKMTAAPARILNLSKGTLSQGADVTIVDMEMEQVVDPSKFQSKGRNTPFSGWKLKGWPVMTMVSGNIAFINDWRLKIDESYSSA